MIRCGQMILSNAVMASEKYFLDKFAHHEEIKDDEVHIIEQFLETENAAFSLTKITDKGFEIF